MTTSNPPTAAQPIDLDKPGFEVFAREACNMPEGIALNWDAAWTKAAYEGWCGALARQQPAARVDRIISASGLAEVSVFLESALKVGTVFYAAAPTCPACQGNDKNMPCAYPSKGMLGCLRDERLPAAAKSEQSLDWPHAPGRPELDRAPLPASAACAGSEQRPAAQARLDGAQVFEFAAPYFAWNAESWQKATQGTIGMPALLNYTRAVVDAAGAGSAPHAQAEPVAWIAYYDGVKSQNVARDRKEKADIEHMAKIMGYAGRLTWEELYNHAAPVPQEAEQAAPLDDNEVARLRRVVRAMGMEKEVPDDDESLRGCVFSVLGMMARKLEAEQAAPAAVTDDLAQAIAACDVNMDETQVEPEDTAAWKIVRAALFSEKRKALELQRVYDERGRQIGRLETAIERAQPAAPAVTDAARDVLADDRYLNDDCDAPMKNGACTECGFGPCRRTQSKE